jgi:hypothetical protein
LSKKLNKSEKLQRENIKRVNIFNSNSKRSQKAKRRENQLTTPGLLKDKGKSKKNPALNREKTQKKPINNPEANTLFIHLTEHIKDSKQPRSKTSHLNRTPYSTNSNVNKRKSLKLNPLRTLALKHPKYS